MTGTPRGDATDDEPGEGSDLEATNRSQRIDRACRDRVAVERKRRVDRRDLARERRVVDTSPAAGDLGRCATGERRDERSRRRRVPDPHVAGDEAARAAGDELDGDGRADVERGARFVGTHRRRDRDVCGPGADAALHDGRRVDVGELSGDTDVDDGDGRADLAGEDVDRRPA